jgi:c-di-GMP-binding flagellar brake protein YcgR
MSGQELKIQPGDLVQVQLFNEEARHFVKVIGYLSGQSLLVSTPTVRGAPMLLRDGQRATVRMLAANTVLGFETQIIKACLTPFPYLHLAYPKEIASTVLRKAQRAVANLIVSVENASHADGASQAQAALLVDVSTSGALLQAKLRLGRTGETLVIKAKLTVAGIEKYISVAAIIRNVREKPGEAQPAFLHGMEFQLLDADQQLVLHGFVYEQIAKLSGS